MKNKYDYDLSDKLYRFKELSPELQVVLINYINTIASGGSLFDATELRDHIEEEIDCLHEQYRRTLKEEYK